MIRIRCTSVLLMLLPLAVIGQTPGASANPPRLPGRRPHAAQAQGPALHPLLGLRPLIADTDRGLVRAAMRDLRTGAVVVVEEDGMSPVPGWPAKSGFTHYFGPLTSRAIMVQPVPAWMDPTKVISGGNTVAQVYPLGWGY